MYSVGFDNQLSSFKLLQQAESLNNSEIGSIFFHIWFTGAWLEYFDVKHMRKVGRGLGRHRQMRYNKNPAHDYDVYLFIFFLFYSIFFFFFFFSFVRGTGRGQFSTL